MELGDALEGLGNEGGVESRGPSSAQKERRPLSRVANSPLATAGTKPGTGGEQQRWQKCMQPGGKGELLDSA